MTAPGVSLLVPARDEAAMLPAALAAIAAQDYDGPVEVVVADASADAATARAVRAACPHARIVANPGGNAAAGMNRALAVARYAIAARCDARCTLPPDYLRRAVAALARTGAANVGGRLLAVGHTPFERAVACAMASRLGSGGTRWRRRGPPGPVESVPLGTFRRAALEAVGGFDAALARNEDYELNWRLRRSGHAVWCDPTLTVRYRPRGDWASLWRQYLDYGRWKRVVAARHPRSLRPRHLAAPTLVAGLAVSVPGALAGLAAGSGTTLAAALAVPAAWLAALAVAAAAAALRERRFGALATAGPLAVMHFSWGVGFLTGAPAVDVAGEGAAAGRRERPA